MSDDPFGDLDQDMAEAMGGGDGEREETADDGSGEASDPDGKESDAGSESEAASSANPRKTPAFEFSETNQEQFYVRESTWDEWEKARDAELKPALVLDDVEDVRGSEIHDAVVRLAADNPEEVAAYVKAERGIED